MQKSRSIRNSFWSLCVVAVIIAVSGCSGNNPATKVAHSCQERIYTGAIIPDGECLGKDWTQQAQAIIAYTPFGKVVKNVKGEEAAVPSIGESKRLLKPKGPCGIFASVAYAKNNSDKPAMTILYLFDRYPALKLKDKDGLPNIQIKEWTRGEDGIALGIAVYDGPEQSGEVASSVKAKGDEKSSGKDMAKEKAESTREDNSKTTNPITPEYKQDEVVKEVANTENNDINESVGSLYYLAASGVLVKIWIDAPENSDDAKELVAKVRKGLAASIARDSRIREELSRQHDKMVKSYLDMDSKWDPNADVYWKLLDFAIGGTIVKKKW